MSQHPGLHKRIVTPSSDSAPGAESHRLPSENFELLWGAEQIAAELSVTTRRAFYLLEQGEIPAQKVGGRWCAARSALRKRFGVV
jgi:hypothetical protein